MCRLFRRTRRGYLRITWVVGQQFDVVADSFHIRAVYAETGLDFFRYAVGVFGGRDISGRAVPAAARFDAEQVEAAFAIAGRNFTLPPAGFQRGLRHDQLVRNAAVFTGDLRRNAQVGDEL